MPIWQLWLEYCQITHSALVGEFGALVGVAGNPERVVVEKASEVLFVEELVGVDDGLGTQVEFDVLKPGAYFFPENFGRHIVGGLYVEYRYEVAFCELNGLEEVFGLIDSAAVGPEIVICAALDCCGSQVPASCRRKGSLRSQTLRWL